MASPVAPASSERASELAANLSDIKSRAATASASNSRPISTRNPTLVAVSKYKPSSDILSCYELGQRDFGENYVQELVDKAKELPQDIRWHFIGTLQSNKSKAIASIPNLYSIQTISSIKTADAVNRALPADRDASPLNILLQVNTSGEDSKSGLPPSASESNKTDPQQKPSESPLFDLAKHVIERCPRLRLQGLMTIGSLSESTSDSDVNNDFETLKNAGRELETRLRSIDFEQGSSGWGEEDRLLLSMGMSSDFETALKAGGDIVRVGTGIFGQRQKKESSA